MKRLAIILLISISAVALGRAASTTRYMCDVPPSATTSTLAIYSSALLDGNQVVSCRIGEVSARYATPKELLELWDRRAFEHYAPKLKPPEPKELKREVK